MTDTIQPAEEAETAAADLNAILADDRSSPAETPQEQAAEPAAHAAPEAKPEIAPEAPKAGPKWYRDALREKDQRLAAAERQARQLQEQMERLQPPPQPLDYSNPQAVFQTFEQRLAESRLEQNIALSARFARREHGAELFDEAAVWLSQRKDIELWAQTQADPWEAAIQRFKQERLADEIGDDPNAYREKLRQEILAELQQQQPGHSPSMTAPRIPAPASGQRSAAPRDGTGRFTGPTPIGNILKG